MVTAAVAAMSVLRRSGETPETTGAVWEVAKRRAEAAALLLATLVAYLQSHKG